MRSEIWGSWRVVHWNRFAFYIPLIWEWPRGSTHSSIYYWPSGVNPSNYIYETPATWQSTHPSFETAPLCIHFWSWRNPLRGLYHSLSIRLSPVLLLPGKALTSLSTLNPQSELCSNLAYRLIRLRDCFAVRAINWLIKNAVGGNTTLHLLLIMWCDGFAYDLRPRAQGQTVVWFITP